MRRKIVAFSIVLGAALSHVATAGTKTFNQSNSTWNLGTNWTPNGVPTEADRVVIPSDKICTVDINTAVADTIDVAGLLVIDTDKKLTLDNDNDNVNGTPDNSSVTGEVQIKHRGTLFFDENSHIVSGSTGKVVGNPGIYTYEAYVEIDYNTTLTNELASTTGGFRKGMQIRGLTSGGQTNGAFHNKGRVEATDAKWIVLHEDTLLSDISSADWVATGTTSTACDSQLQFKRETLTLNGDFLIHSGNLNCLYASIQTCGGLAFNWGSISLSQNTTFAFVTYSNSSDPGCPNPGVGKSPTTCDAPWTVYSTSQYLDCNCVAR